MDNDGKKELMDLGDGDLELTLKELKSQRLQMSLSLLVVEAGIKDLERRLKK